jgi:hypothetical protein
VGFEHVMEQRNLGAMEFSMAVSKGRSSFSQTTLWQFSFFVSENLCVSVKGRWRLPPHLSGARLTVTRYFS